MKYYAVHAGKKPGIYSNWNDCKAQIDGFSKPIFKKFENIKDAQLFLKNGFSIDTKKGFSNNFKHNIDKKNEKKLEDLLNEQDNRIFVYSDGSCIKFKNGIFKAGYGIYIPQKNLKISEPLLNQKQTNNRAELTAILKTFDYLTEDDLKKEIIMITDSQYSIYIFDKTGENYERNNYMKDGQEVLNKDLIIKALKIKRKYNLQLIKIRAHTNKDDIHSKNNEIVDHLAKKGVSKGIELERTSSIYNFDKYDGIDMNQFIQMENKGSSSKKINKDITMNDLFEYDSCSSQVFEKNEQKYKKNNNLKKWFIKK